MKKSTKIIIAIVAILVIAGAVVATLFFTGVIGKKKPKDGFYEYLDQTISFEDSDFNIKETIASLKQASTKSCETTGKISMNVDLKGALASYNEIAKILNKVELGYDAKLDPKSTKMSSSVNVKYDGKDLGTLEIVANEDVIGLKFAEIYDKYLTISMDDVIDALDDSGVDFEEIMSSVDSVDINAIADIFDISNDEIKRIVNRYKDVLKNTLPEENYSSEKEKITVNGKEIDATGYTIKLSDKDLIKVAKKALDSLSKDDDTLSLVVNKVEKVMDLAGQRANISKSELSSGIGMLVEALDGVEKITGKTIKITLYEYKNKTVRMAISVGDDAIIIDDIKDKDTENMALKVKFEGKEVTLFNIEQIKKGDNKYSTKLSTDLGEISEEMAGMKFEITVDTDGSKLNMKLNAELEGIANITLNVEEEAKYTSVNIDKITSSNSTDVKKLTQAQTMELAAGVVEYVEDKVDVINDIAKVLGYEDEVEELVSQFSTFKTQLSSSKVNETVNVDEGEEADVDEDTELDEAV